MRALNQADLSKLQRDTFTYFTKEQNPANGLIPDNTREGAPCSITAVGLALACYVVGVERGFITRQEAIQRVLAILRFFWESPQGMEPNATGHKGFYYHFLDMQSGRRVWKCELSTIDTTFLVAGMLACQAYFTRRTQEEKQIRKLAQGLYERVDWQWALDSGETVSHGWKPESGFLKYRWQGYSEALLLYVLGLGSPTHPLPKKSYPAWTQTYKWKKLYGYEFLYAGPLFIHQLSHIWIDFRGIQDAFMRGKKSDYFENSRRASYAQQQYAIRNPKGFKGYNAHCWGITASDGPGPLKCRIDGIPRRFYDYIGRGVPYGPDDGTIAPWAAAASLPFAPEIVLPTLQYFNDTFPEMTSEYGFKCSFNPTFQASGATGWISEGYYGLDQGPIILMIENYRSDFFWEVMKRCPVLMTGLRRAGFKNGWLNE